MLRRLLAALARREWGAAEIACCTPLLEQLGDAAAEAREAQAWRYAAVQVLPCCALVSDASTCGPPHLTGSKQRAGLILVLHCLPGIMEDGAGGCECKWFGSGCFRHAGGHAAGFRASGARRPGAGHVWNRPGHATAGGGHAAIGISQT